jgi:hypothetical protein
MTWDLFRAEWRKIQGNRYAVIFLLWIFPVMALVMVVGAILFALFSADYRTAIEQWDVTWTGRFLETWSIPNNELGRFVILAFTAVVFAGEYQYGTWKNMIPRQPRARLILNKFLTIGVFVVVAFIAMSLIAGVGTGIVNSIAGVSYGPEPSGEVVGEFTGDYLTQMSITLVSTFIATAYAAFGAMIARNILGGLVIGGLFQLGESGLLAPLALVRLIFNIDLFWLYQYTPSYNLANIGSLLGGGDGATIMDMVPHALPLSMLIVAVWVVGLVTLTVVLFRRQDVTT